MKSLILAMIIGFYPVAASAAQGELPKPWTQPQVMMLAHAIDMSQEQIPAFRSRIGAFIDSYYTMVRTELWRNNADKKQTIERRTGKLARDLDTSMSSILDADQLVAYQTYRNALMASLATGGNNNSDENQAVPYIIPHH